jgi:hypothetical protein
MAEGEGDWRTKCIEEFKLLPIPATWSDQVARGSEQAWKNYFEYRKNQGSVSGKRIIEKKDDDDDLKEILKEWDCNMEVLEFEIFPEQELNDPEQLGLWQTHLRVDNLVNEYDDVISAQFRGHVYSPYAIPHAIHLQHGYHRRPRWSTMEFFLIWGYKLLDFEEAQDEDDESDGFTTICSNCYEDEQLRADVIDVSHLNQNTVNLLRRFLFGAIEESKAVSCDDFSFLRLLFGSMGTFGDDGAYETVPHGWIGYSWTIPRESNLRENMIMAIGGERREDFFDISWLEHGMREAAGALRAIDAYYTAPTIQDAPGYRAPYSDDDSY